MTVARELDRPDAVIFDWDSTLVDNWASIVKALNATLAMMGHGQWTATEVRERTRSSARESFPKLFGMRWQEAEHFFYERFNECHLEEVRPLPGAERVISLLADCNVPMAVVSNKSGPYLRTEAEVLGWTGRFAAIVGATDAERDKPASDPVRMAAAAAGVPAGPGIWFVGDSAVDLQCAHAANCVPILVESGVITAAEIAQWPPAARLATCETLADLITEVFAGSSLTTGTGTLNIKAIVG